MATKMENENAKNPESKLNYMAAVNRGQPWVIEKIDRKSKHISQLQQECLSIQSKIDKIQMKIIKAEANNEADRIRFQQILSDLDNYKSKLDANCNALKVNFDQQKENEYSLDDSKHLQLIQYKCELENALQHKRSELETLQEKRGFLKNKKLIEKNHLEAQIRRYRNVLKDAEKDKDLAKQRLAALRSQLSELYNG